MNVQYKKGVLELCVLALLSRGDRYGYDVSELLSRKIDISDGSRTAAGRRANTTGSRGWAKRNTGVRAPNGLHLRRRSANC